MRKIQNSNRAAAGSQYALIVGLIAVLALAALANTGTSVVRILAKTGDRLDNAVGQSDGRFLAPTGPTGTRIFETAANYDGNLGGLTGADAKCMADSNRPSDNRTYIAFLSSSTVNASSRVSFTFPVRRADNPSLIVANSQIIGGGTTLVNPIGTQSGTASYARTASNSNNGNLTGPTCNDWTSNVNIGNWPTNTMPQLGQGDQLNAGWLAAFSGPTSDCSYAYHLYCVSTVP